MTPKKILVIEDNTDAREMLSALLATEGFAVTTAEDGLVGLSKVEAEKPELIITDINMPNLNGIDLIKALRDQPEYSALPIMVLTAYGDVTASAAINAGANYATIKPVDFESLLSTIRELLKG